MTRISYSYFRGGNLAGVGFERAGFRDIGGVEFDKGIAAVADLNFPSAPTTVADVCAVDPALLLDEAPTHFHASPSCKNASQANQPDEDEDGIKTRETEGDRDAGRAVARFIRHWTPPYVTIENVWMYRSFDAFGFILQALKDQGYSFDYWHLNSADYGVPQTRKRLILIAKRGLHRIQRPHPTHRKGGDMFHQPWRGWYGAIEDLLPGLPDTTPAPWQLARLPAELRETLLIGPGGYDGTVVQVGQHEPSFTVPAAGNHVQWRAFIVSNAATEYGDGLRDDSEPMFSITTQEWGKGYRVGDGSSPTVRTDGMPRALLVGGQYMEPSGTPDRRVQHAGPLSPSWTVTTGAGKDTRAYVHGVWKRLTVQALGRFQTVPDEYRGLTPEVNGNGVPCELARVIGESLL